MRGPFLLFLLLPITELWLLLTVGEAIGAWTTLGLVLLTAIIGVNVLRHQGFATMRRAQQRMDAGELPGLELVEGFLLAIGGAMLLTPGFITDSIGFTLLLPPSRRALARWLLASGRVQSWHGGSSYTVFRSRSGPRPPPGKGDILEGELDDEPGDKPGSGRLPRE